MNLTDALFILSLVWVCALVGGLLFIVFGLTGAQSSISITPPNPHHGASSDVVCICANGRSA
jgi:hypothetical protein